MDVPKMELFPHGNLIPVVTSIMILGFRIEASGQNTETVKALEKSVHETARLISMVARKITEWRRIFYSCYYKRSF